MLLVHASFALWLQNANLQMPRTDEPSQPFDLLMRRPRLARIAQEAAEQGTCSSTSIASALGLNPGSTLRDLRSLRTAGLLVSHPIAPGGTGGPSPSSAEHFAIAGQAARDLVASTIAALDDGRLGKGTHLALVSTEELAALASAFLDNEALAGIAWFAPCVDSSLGGVVAIKGSSVAARISGLSQLRQHGLSLRPVAVECCLSGDALRSWARDALEASPRLPAPE